MLTASPTTLSANVLPCIPLSQFKYKTKSKMKVMTGDWQLNEQISFAEEGQELTDFSYVSIPGYQRTVFIPVRGIYIQSQLVSKFHTKETVEQKKREENKHQQLALLPTPCRNTFIILKPLFPTSTSPLPPPSPIQAYLFANPLLRKTIFIQSPMTALFFNQMSSRCFLSWSMT